MLMGRTIVQKKMDFLKSKDETELLANFTIDSPVPFDIEILLKELDRYIQKWYLDLEVKSKGIFSEN